MAKKQESFVEFIANPKVDFPRWYTDVILQSQMVDYGPVHGTMVIRPYGYRIWELLQAQLNERIIATGHENAYFPLFIPESYLRKEAEHIEGFAPEVAWVTQGGDEVLTERIVVRPTSETIFCAMYSKWVQSWRDLPMKLNQWANVVRWEKTTRPFLRTSEFLWQEGHTIHATPEEAEEETMLMLEVYREFCESVLAIPMVTGRKTEKEKFAGAVSTFSIEALMQDGKALQSGTSHNFAQHFSKVFDIKFQNKEGQEEYVYETSWGVSTRLIGAIVMVHGDERGLVLPPRVAPHQVVIVPVAAHKGGVSEACEALYERLTKAGIRVKLDDRDTVSPGFKFNEWELKGVPLRLEIGPRDLEKNQAYCLRRDTLEKFNLSLDDIEDSVKEILASIHDTMLEKARAFLAAHTFDAHSLEEMQDRLDNGRGYVRAMWCGDQACEDKIKELYSATSRNYSTDPNDHIDDVCVCCGRKAQHLVYWARAY